MKWDFVWVEDGCWAACLVSALSRIILLFSRSPLLCPMRLTVVAPARRCTPCEAHWFILINLLPVSQKAVLVNSSRILSNFVFAHGPEDSVSGSVGTNTHRIGKDE